MAPDNIQFRTGVIKPMECVKEGWALIKDQYWLFLGIVFVGVFIGSAVPIVLIGPMIVGINLCFLRKMRGEPVEFGHLFKGFDYFAQSLIAALLQMIPMVIVMVPLYIIMFAFMMISVPRGGQMSSDESATFALTFLGFYVVFIVVMIAVVAIVTIFFMFAFPLIADRNLSGVDAVKLSIKAAWANFGGVCGLVLICVGLGILGVLACYVGALLVMPVSLAAYAVAYRRVFPESLQNFAPPPPPPANWAA
jgi:uncharacterized membrane protein